ncbi:autotransporter domain-containing protein, partial [Sansalvadorimonas verongulae]|uniref:autotransporter domain-containing protein n=1 Tax=Sansalvadorimonas verongulae TaxID=2172824 RepID=UPI0012BD0060
RRKDAEEQRIGQIAWEKEKTAREDRLQQNEHFKAYVDEQRIKYAEKKEQKAQKLAKERMAVYQKQQEQKEQDEQRRKDAEEERIGQIAWEKEKAAREDRIQRSENFKTYVNERRVKYAEEQEKERVRREEARRNRTENEYEDDGHASYDGDEGDGAGRMHRRLNVHHPDDVETLSQNERDSEVPPSTGKEDDVKVTDSLNDVADDNSEQESKKTSRVGEPPRNKRSATQAEAVAALTIVAQPQFDSALVAALPATATETVNNATMQMFSGHHQMISNFRNGRRLGGVGLDRVDSSAVEASLSSGLKGSLQTDGVYSYASAYSKRGNASPARELPGYNNKGYGFEAGIFRVIDSELLLGVMVSAENSKLSLKGKGGSTDITSLRAGPFFSWKSDDFHIDGALTVGHHDVSAKAHDTIGDERYKGHYSMNDWAAWIGSGYDIHMDAFVSGLTITPMAEVMYIDSRSSGFGLKNDNKTRVKVQGSSRHDRIDRFGLMMDYQVPDYSNMGSYLSSVYGGFGVQTNHFADHQATMSHADGGSSVTEKRKQRDHKMQWYKLGVNSQLSDTRNLSFDLEGTRGRNSNNYGASITFEQKF